ncbi:gamma-glutamyl-gamma-aminobutyrate hydrolase family protein [Anaerobacillus isosaccharinicus]|uniref:Gamma-glutamyl-gamma-aminobutyrate hydrolase n=1 Tax=Anaerobacillus isosaccharinicus TaxID=1532552 RepID=A0A1S2MFP4_9BACI|nr:gamma-glutamyl-gamma-aminobutyrate hydrolase family protein [Anaerobacillus isosaccharinicus]MBA5586682.1 gamma-glutamyl-gamma-aminobutyrate hydrolase family protein [Anaerobacillus isosaccharinicus]QOY35087.1 gamma-glutamyl-gamma-aminobutyrate hydrolase family protein [Anaerobacillus isosaccharinicus]
MQTRPVIGISSSIEKHNQIPSVHVFEKFVRAVTDGGGLPIVIPIGTEDMAASWISICDGLVLSSGEDIDPSSFNANPSTKIQKTNGKRDKIEIALIHEAIKQQKPILGICRGITMLNAALGGTVIQDVATEITNAINHFQQAERPDPTHEIKLDANSRLHEIFQRSKLCVNSIHHQSIDKLALSLKTVAIAPDGVIEAVESKDGSLIWGIQWHPEEMAVEDPSMALLFKEFVSECKRV